MSSEKVIVITGASTGIGEATARLAAAAGYRVTLTEPGVVDTPFYDDPPAPGALTAEDVARTVMFAIEQPAHVDINELLVRPAR